MLSDCELSISQFFLTNGDEEYVEIFLVKRLTVPLHPLLAFSKVYKLAFDIRGAEDSSKVFTFVKLH